MSNSVRVHLELSGADMPVGTAFFHLGRGSVSTTFTYDQQYVASRGAYAFDPALPLSTAPSTVRGLPGAFQDCSPDRWGRNLVQKEHRRLVAEAEVRDRTLTDVDYLLGVSDYTRQGGLRFKAEDSGEYLTPGTKVPKLVSLPALQHAADLAAGEDGQAIKELLDAGTGSLGGARPKASVLGDDEHLMIAKFSHANDDWNVIAWEKAALEIAKHAGVDTPTSRLYRLDNRPALVLARFDRDRGERLGYMSAMTAARRSDGESADYLDIVEAIEDFSSHYRRDAAELFRRVALSVAIRNTDDHLRNHGFLRRQYGWELSPIFDVNPQPDLSVHRQTAINGVTTAENEPEALMELAPYCQLSASTAKQIVTEVSEAVEAWPKIAHKCGISDAEINRFHRLFDSQRRGMKKVV